MNKANECSCPSGDGSLVHPCPAHPAVEQACWDERDFQAKGAQEVPSPVSKEYDRHLIGLLRKGEALPGHQEEAADEIERLRDWNDHLNNTVLPNILNPNFLMLMKGGERLLDLCTKDGKFIGVSLNDMKDVFDWMVTHARIAPDHAALAQPSPAQAEQHWPKLEKPAQVGAIRFSAGVSSRLVVEAAQRLYEFESTPEKEAERIERLQAFREQCFEPLGTEFSKVLSENLVELSSDAKPEQAEAERPEIVATLFTPNEKVHNVIGFKAFAVAGDCDKEGGEFYDPEKLMTVAQHARIVGALRAKADQLREALEWRAENQAGQRELLRSVKAERDAALAEVAGLRSLLNSLLCYVERDIDRMRSDRDKSDNKEIYDRSISLAMERLKAAQNAVFTTEPGCDTAVELAAQTTQAQHCVPEISGIGRDAEHPRAVVLYLRNEPSEEDMRAIQNFLRAISADVLTQAQHSAGYAEARMCANCRHIGINDAADYAACHDCNWTGPEPDEDKCPGCAGENCMAAACPECGGRYDLVAEANITAPAGQVPQAWLDVQAERRRQITAEGWTPEHDDEHDNGEMARAAACYALAGSSAPSDGTAALLVSLAWPWDEQWWKPSTARRDMVKACALGLAEIERLDRVAASQGGPSDA
ncbi:hypothetical protein MX952_003645 [Pseudomonas aeruginosa]|nr:hypothetical protein MOX62_11740 [Pseudomonas aeruginosa]